MPTFERKNGEWRRAWFFGDFTKDELAKETKATLIGMVLSMQDDGKALEEQLQVTEANLEGAKIQLESRKRAAEEERKRAHRLRDAGIAILSSIGPEG